MIKKKYKSLMRTGEAYLHNDFYEINGGQHKYMSMRMCIRA